MSQFRSPRRRSPATGQVQTAAEAKAHALHWVASHVPVEVLTLGLPEVDDRYNVWRVALLDAQTGARVGEVVLDVQTARIDEARTTNPFLLKARYSRNSEQAEEPGPIASPLPVRPGEDWVLRGESEQVLDRLPEESVQLIFTSPPYYNARPEYSEYPSYEAYLESLRRVIRGAARVLCEGRFFVMNTSPVLLRRASRNQASRRLAVPFDLHGIFIQEGFEFIDDIHWVKPEGAGWATGRGRRFAADRNPMQYKAVPVTEYVLVYRKTSPRLIDWHIRQQSPETLRASKIGDDYERTNLWKIHPATHPVHPAVFPEELARKVIQYYSFVGDRVLDPYAGTGTVGQAAQGCGRHFLLIERQEEYLEIIKELLPKGRSPESPAIHWG